MKKNNKKTTQCINDYDNYNANNNNNKNNIRRVKLIYKSNLNAGNFISGWNAWAIGVTRYSRGIIDLTEEELQDMDQKTRKIMSLNRCLHPRSSVIVYEAERRRERTHKCGELYNN